MSDKCCLRPNNNIPFLLWFFKNRGVFYVSNQIKNINLEAAGDHACGFLVSFLCETCTNFGNSYISNSIARSASTRAKFSL